MCRKDGARFLRKFVDFDVGTPVAPRGPGIIARRGAGFSPSAPPSGVREKRQKKDPAVTAQQSQGPVHAAAIQHDDAMVFWVKRALVALLVGNGALMYQGHAFVFALSCPHQNYAVK